MKLPKMESTIKQRLFFLMICGLLCVAAVGATGYWGIKAVEKTTAQVAATSTAIRNHIEAGVFNDLTQEDISSLLTKKVMNSKALWTISPCIRRCWPNILPRPVRWLRIPLLSQLWR